MLNLLFHYLKYLSCSFLLFSAITTYAANPDSVKIENYLSKLDKIDAKNVDSLVQMANQFSAEFLAENNQYGLYKIKADVGFLLSKYGFYQLSIKYYLEALQHAESVSNKTYTVKVLNAVGAYYGRKGDAEKSETYLLKAALLADKIGYFEGLISSYFKLGSLRISQNKPKESLVFYDKIDSLNKDLKTKYLVPDALANKGIIFAMSGNLDTALHIFNESYQYSIKTKNVIDQILALQNTGLVYKEKGDYKTALSNFNKGVILAEKHGLIENKIKIAINIPLLFFIQNNADDAYKFAKQLLKDAEKIELESAQIEIQNMMIEIAKSQGNYKLATQHLEALSSLKSKLNKQDKNKALAEAAIELDLYKTQREMKSTIDLLFETKKQRNIILAGLLLLVTLLIISGFLLLRIKKLNEKLNKNKTKLINSNNNKNKLFSIIGHDLRSAYSSTLGVLGLLKSGDLTKEEEGEYLDKVINQSNAALITLDDLLMWGHAQIKGTHLEKKQINPLNNFEKTISFYHEQLKTKNIELLNKVEPQIHVYMDENHFLFIIRNLIANAIKYTPNNGIIEITASLHQKDYIKFCVKDSGIGIDEDKLETIFLPESTSKKGTNNEQGTGLGLTLCKEFVETNGGEIWAENIISGGCKICFTSKKG
ncbi:tetratricopeptide repeat-containing sensor histidine kinase [Pedobacter alpinus]|uniref:histidine kinase n=1 Tax=Pedobacter alpinus TaxID=1590643 RepID=A0ABW5TNB5_9SPHI